MQFARIELAEVFIARQHVAHLPHTVFTFTREQHPQVLHGRSHAAIVEIDEVRTLVRPQHVACVAVAMQTQLLHIARTVKAVAYTI